MTNLRVLIAAAIFAAVAVIGPYARAEDKSISLRKARAKRSTPPGVAMPTLNANDQRA